MNEQRTANILWFGEITDEQRAGLAETVNRGKPDDAPPLGVNIIEKPAFDIPDNASQKDQFITIAMQIMLAELSAGCHVMGFSGVIPPKIWLSIVEAYKGRSELPSFPIAFFFENPLAKGEFTLLVGPTLQEHLDKAKANKAEDAA